MGWAFVKRRMTAELGADHFPGFGMKAMGALMNHDWPGNVRELKNAVERAVYRTLAAESRARRPIDDIQLDPFESPWRLDGGAKEDSGQPAETIAPAMDSKPRDFKQSVETFEKSLVESALKTHDGHQGKAAEHLALSYHQFRNLLRKHEINSHQYRT